MPLAADHLADLTQALLDEERARVEVKAALHRQAVALRELRRLGLPASVVAHRVATARGLVLGLADRLRLAERLRKRAWRGTRCPTELALPHGPRPSATPSSTWAGPPDHQEATMAKLVKRTITEEFIETKKPDEDEDQVEEDVDQDADVEEEPEGDAPTPRKRRRRR